MQVAGKFDDFKETIDYCEVRSIFKNKLDKI